ncbi:MAG: glycerophosphodiester phosphodiesterase family protein [Tissierellia bacterium]|nr:glycerophosphodiester phosphodiesterase family protein [Tissierellia bacterium]
MEERWKEKKFIIVSHRGFWGGNIIQNTIESARIAYLSGADMVEVDLCRSKDGHYYCFHDGNEKLLLGEDRPFSQWTKDEIDSRDLINSTGGFSGKTLENWDDYLKIVAREVIINLDRSWIYWKDGFLDELAEKPESKRVLLKSPVSEELLSLIGEHEGLYYMPIVSTMEEVEQVFKQLKPYAMEIIADSVDAPLWRKDVLDQIRQEGVLLYGNLEKLSKSRVLLAGWDDDIFLEKKVHLDPLLERGFRILQTDWPHLLNRYR